MKVLYAVLAVNAAAGFLFCGWLLPHAGTFAWAIGALALICFIQVAGFGYLLIDVRPVRGGKGE